jgi:carbon storage regulator CsrA
MLVLSRRPQQLIRFPTLGISVQILRVARQSVRLGVEAPQSIPVLRGELDRQGQAGDPLPSAGPAAEDAARQARHQLRGRLNTATMALYLAQRQLQAGMTTHAEGTLQQAIEELERLDGELANGGPAPTRPARRIRTLLVEDNPHESALLESYLRLYGVDVANASDGHEALDYLSSHEVPDAVLLDMRMPRCDGPATVAAIRGNPALARLKIFAVSGTRPQELEMPTGPGGVDGWFTKPLNPARLVDTLAVAFG